MKGKAIYETWVWFEKNQQLYDVFGFGTVDKEQWGKQQMPTLTVWVLRKPKMIAYDGVSDSSWQAWKWMASRSLYFIIWHSTPLL